MSDALDIVERLRHFCTDWDGSSMSDHTEPMPGLHCVELREAADEIERLRAALTAPAVPAGWQLVPVEPTPEMIAAMAVIDSSGTCNGTPTVGMAGADEAYAAMLAAAPQAPAP